MAPVKPPRRHRGVPAVAPRGHDCDNRAMGELTIPADLLPADPRFGSGPSRIRPEALAALDAPDSVLGTSHRHAPVRHLVGRLREELAELYHLPAGHEVVLGNGGATLFWDMAAACLVGHRSANGIFGEFGRKFASVLQRAPFLADPAVFEAPAGQLAVPTAVSGVGTYAWPHNETSTGVVAPVARPDDIDEDALVLVDATSAAGGIDAELSGIDAYYFSPQKNFASDGGLWVAFLSPAAVERVERLTASARWIPDVLNLRTAVEQSRRNQTLNTPALATLTLMEAQTRWLLDQGGMTWAAQRTRTTSGKLFDWAEGHPLVRPAVADPALRSPVTVTLTLDEKVDAERVREVARANGILDLEPYRGQDGRQIRVATFTSVTPGDVEALIACLDWIIERVVDED